MHFSWHALSLLSLCVISRADFLGSPYPPPVDLASETSIVAQAWVNLTTAVDGYLRANQTSLSNPLVGAKDVTFSFGLLSIHDAGAAKLQYHHTSPEIANQTNGTTKVNGHSIYRMASVSKLFTVFAGMLELTDEDWNRPLTAVIPGLAHFTPGNTSNMDPLHHVQWDKITLWALATQLSGITALGIPAADLLYKYILTAATTPSLAINPVTAFGFPPLNLSVLGPCAANLSQTLCSTDALIESIRSQPPSFLPWTSPAYSDLGFMLLGLAISSITGKSRDEFYHSSIFAPLNMTSSFSSIPTEPSQFSRSVITRDFLVPGGFTIPSGGLFSTINDLAKFGIGILNSTLLPANTTRKWMKPVTHTPSLSYSVGAPWEIIRWQDPSTGEITDIYTKLGDSGMYGGALALVPEFGAGFSFLAAATNDSLRGTVDNLVLDQITEAVLPALKAQAAAEAVHNYVGMYVSSDPRLNSSVTIAHNASTVPGAASGLTLSSWISNGTDVLASTRYLASSRACCSPSHKRMVKWLSRLPSSRRLVAIPLRNWDSLRASMRATMIG